MKRPRQEDDGGSAGSASPARARPRSDEEAVDNRSPAAATAIAEQGHGLSNLVLATDLQQVLRAELAGAVRQVFEKLDVQLEHVTNKLDVQRRAFDDRLDTIEQNYASQIRAAEEGYERQLHVVLSNYEVMEELTKSVSVAEGRKSREQAEREASEQATEQVAIEGAERDPREQSTGDKEKPNRLNEEQLEDQLMEEEEKSDESAGEQIEEQKREQIGEQAERQEDEQQDDLDDEQQGELDDKQQGELDDEQDDEQDEKQDDKRDDEGADKETEANEHSVDAEATALFVTQSAPTPSPAKIAAARSTPIKRPAAGTTSSAASSGTAAAAPSSPPAPAVAPVFRPDAPNFPITSNADRDDSDITYATPDPEDLATIGTNANDATANDSATSSDQSDHSDDSAMESNDGRLSAESSSIDSQSLTSVPSSETSVPATRPDGTRVPTTRTRYRLLTLEERAELGDIDPDGHVLLAPKDPHHYLSLLHCGYFREADAKPVPKARTLSHVVLGFENGFEENTPPPLRDWFRMHLVVTGKGGNAQTYMNRLLVYRAYVNSGRSIKACLDHYLGEERQRYSLTQLVKAIEAEGRLSASRAWLQTIYPEA